MKLPYDATGVVLWEGESALDGRPIAMIATNVARKSSAAQNRKLGDCVSTWILRSDVSPYEAMRTGGDESICGTCALRGDGTGKGRACYVHLGMVNTIWEADERGAYAFLYEVGEDLDDALKRIFGHRVVRLGAYGDPAAVPVGVIHGIASHARATIGYTHAWRTCPARLKRYVMASVDSPEERRAAVDLGWRTFRTRLSEELLEDHEIACPAAEESKRDGEQRTQCDRCRLCDGARAGGDPRRDIAIVAHGWGPAVTAYRRLRLPIVGARGAA